MRDILLNFDNQMMNQIILGMLCIGGFSHGNQFVKVETKYPLSP